MMLKKNMARLRPSQRVLMLWNTCGMRDPMYRRQLAYPSTCDFHSSSTPPDGPSGPVGWWSENIQAIRPATPTPSRRSGYVTQAGKSGATSLGACRSRGSDSGFSAAFRRSHR